MNRMEKVFGEMKGKGEKIFVAYFPLCDPVLEDQVAWAGRYFENGVTVLEMGIPYENPCLDGRTVRDSMARALEKYDVEDAFAVIGRLREAYPDRILQVMVYYEVISKMGISAFARCCADSGADAVLCPNAPANKRAEMDRELTGLGMFHLRFSPYTLDEETEKDLITNARGYIFQQAVNGATGPQETVSSQVGKNISQLKRLGIQTPVLGGFGISSAEQAAEVCAMGADGVIVGSAVISAIIDGHGEAFIKGLRQALDSDR